MDVLTSFNSVVAFLVHYRCSEAAFARLVLASPRYPCGGCFIAVVAVTTMSNFVSAFSRLDDFHLARNANGKFWVCEGPPVANRKF